MRRTACQHRVNISRVVFEKDVSDRDSLIIAALAHQPFGDGAGYHGNALALGQHAEIDATINLALCDPHLLEILSFAGGMASTRRLNRNAATIGRVGVAHEDVQRCGR